MFLPLLVGLVVILMVTVLVLLTTLLCSRHGEQQEEEEEIFTDEEDSFSGIKNNEQFSNAIQMSFVNQKVTLARIVDKEKEQLTFQCISCSVVMVEEKEEYNCPHCGGVMVEGL